MPPLRNQEYTVGWICALSIEMAAARVMLDEVHGKPLEQHPVDQNNYLLGNTGPHNIAIACLPAGVYGTTSAATVAAHMLASFESIRFGLMVGIGGGIPSEGCDIRLGDVVISEPGNSLGGVVQYDFGKTGAEGQFTRTGSLNQPPLVLLNAVASLRAEHEVDDSKISQFLREIFQKHKKMQAGYKYQGASNDRLYEADYKHEDDGDDMCNYATSTRLCVGLIETLKIRSFITASLPSGNQVIKHGVTRDRLRKELGVICFEMEAAGLMNSFRALLYEGSVTMQTRTKTNAGNDMPLRRQRHTRRSFLAFIPANQVDITPAAAELIKAVKTVHDQNERILVINQEINQKIDLAKLPSAEDAAFDSHREELDARCHPDTRVNLLRQIREWAQDPQGKCIFWLNGMAGTGKSTISRTVAQSLDKERQLGASFFFKRGEGDRGKARRFFTTIATQLVVKLPALKPYVKKAIDADPAISDKSLKEQFEKLIFQPLSEIKPVPLQSSKLVLVFDALDECEQEGHIRTILHLLSKTKNVRSVSLRIFVTSRPDLPIRLGFKDISGDTYQDLVLHEIPQATIEHDISVFLKDEFGKIRDEFAKVRDKNILPIDWPGETKIQALVRMATPLFISAATMCRFIGDRRWDPKEQLAAILEYQPTSETSKLDGIYLPVLNRLLVDLTEKQKAKLTQEFREVVGSIVILADPLSALSLARLLGISKENVDRTLDPLHSILSVPTDQDSSVRLLHLSFYDFLLDTEKRGQSPFWVNERETHETLATRCLDLMSCLSQNICHLESPATLRSDIDSQTRDSCLPAGVRYACRYWIHHLKKSEQRIRDQDAVHTFFLKHFLHWLEALSLIGVMSESISLISTLQSLIAKDESSKVSHFLYDAKCFILQNRGIADTAPLQLYSSAIIFAPETSIIRHTFEDQIPRWICKLPKMQPKWDPRLQMLKGHTSFVTSIAFSPDGQLLASGSYDKTVRLWNPATGEQLQKLEGHTGSVTSIAFSPDGQLLASGSWDETVRLWNPATGEQLQKLEGHTESVTSIAFSPDGQLLASGSWDETVRLWNPATGEQLQKLEGHTESVTSIAFSPDGQLLASGSWDETVRLWNPATGEQLQKLEGHTNSVTSIAFSPDGQLLASGSWDETVRLWNPATGEQLQKLEGHTESVTSIAFSPDGQLLASGSRDKTVRLWNPAAREQLQKLEGHTDSVISITFSPDGQLLASGSDDKTVRLWNPATGKQLQKLEGHTDSVTSIAFSPDGQLLASGSRDKTVRLWNPAAREQLQKLEGHTNSVTSIAFSPDGQLLASGSWDETVRLWNPATGEQLQKLEGHTNSVTSIAFSPDGQLLASGSWDETVRLWNPATGEQLQKLEGHTESVTSIAFSPDGQLLASGSWDETVRLWNPATGEQLQKLEGHTNSVTSIAFSPDGQLLASGSWDETVRLWNPATGEQLQKLEGHTESVTSIAFSPDGQLLASGSRDKTVRLWNPAAREQLQKLEGHTTSVTSIAFSPDGQLLASGSWDETVRVWNSATGEQLQKLEVGVSVGMVSFSSKGPFLETDQGLLKVECYTPLVSPQTEPITEIFVTEQWVTRDSMKLLLLPSEYMPACSTFQSNVLVLGCSSGQLIFLEFNNSVEEGCGVR